MSILVKIKNWTVKMLSDESGNPSSKRVVGVIASLSLVASLLIGSFTNLQTAPSDTLITSVAALAFGALGLSTADKVAKFMNTKKED
jgi:hypothetical protein